MDEGPDFGFHKFLHDGAIYGYFAWIGERLSAVLERALP